MQDAMGEQDFRDRLSLIERMIAEGRRSTESWGWTFVLWGVVYYLAFAWSAWGHSSWAWPVTTLTAVIVTVLVASRRHRGHPETTLGRSIAAVWVATGISMFLLFFTLGATGRLSDPHTFMAVVAAMLGMANGASAMMLRWRVQLACAIVWWIAVVATCFGSNEQSTMVFLVAVFLCQIAFGIYGMIADGQFRHRHGALHA